MNKHYLPFLLFLFLFPFALLCQTPTASIATWKDNRKAAYTIIHDDFSSWVTGIYQYADPIATARGIKLAFGAITSGCTSTEWSKANTMISHGHECINHSHNHNCGGATSYCSGLTQYSVPPNENVELVQSTNLIETNTGRRPRFFIHPYDAVIPGDAPSTAILNYLTSIGYLGTRAGTQGTSNASSYTDYMHMNFNVFDGTETVAQLNSVVSNAINAGTYVLREFHGVADGSWAAMTVANYTSHLDFVKTHMDNGDLWATTPTEVITYEIQRNAFQPVATYVPATGNINVTFNSPSLNSTVLSVLNTPMSASVTVNVNVSTLTSTFNVYQNNTIIPSIRNGNVVTFNVYPHLGGVELRCTNCGPPVPVNVTNLIGTANPSSTSIGLTWTNPSAGNMSEIMVVASASPFLSNELPAGDGSAYTADANFGGSGTPLDGGVVVYKGTVESASINNLTSSTPYYYKVFTRLNTDWSSGVSGTTTTAAPPTPLNVTSLTSTPALTSIGLTWTNPVAANMTEIMVVASTGVFSNVAPTGDGSSYTADPDFLGAGTSFDGGKVIYKGTVASATISNLTNATTYNYKIFTRLVTEWSPGVSGTTNTLTPPLNVTNLAGTAPTLTSIALTWTNPPPANMTEIMVVASTGAFTSAIPTGNGSTYTANASFAGAGTAFDGGKVVYKGTVASATITNLTSNTAYNYKVFTRLGSLWSSGVTGTTPTPIPPVNVTALTGTPTPTTIALTWTNPAAANMTEIMVVAKIGAFTTATPTGDGTTYTAVANFTGAGTAFDGGKVVYKGTVAGATIAGLTASTAYNYKVFTRRGSFWSSGVTGTTTTSIPPLNVTNLLGSTPTPTNIALTWTNPAAANMTQIMVVASLTPFTAAIPTGDGTTYTAVADFTGAGTAFDGGKVVYKGTVAGATISGLTGSTAYNYKVFTRLGSFWSTGVSGSTTTAIPPLNVTALTGSTPSVTSIALAWTNPAAANMTEIMVVASTSPFTTAVPTGNGSTYTAVAAFTGAGTAFDGGKVVYKGTVAGVTITGLTSTTAYYYKVFTRLGSFWSSGVSGTTTTPIPPLNVTALTGTPTPTTIALAWTNPAAANMTEIMVVAKIGAFTTVTPNGDGTSYTAVADFTGAGAAFDGGKVVYKGTVAGATITGLTGTTAYNYKVFTRLGNYWSSGVSGTTTTSIPPLNVTALTSSTPSVTSVALAWTNPAAANMTEIMVVASLTPFTTTIPTGNGTTYTAVADFSGAGTAFDGGKVVYKGTVAGATITNLVSSTPYYYKVFTRLGSFWSSGVSGTTTTPIPPLNITNLIGSTPSVTSIGLAWTNPAAANMTEIMVVASTGAFTAAIPTGDGTAYTAVAAFTGAGTAFDGGKVVYKGTVAGSTITGLTSSTAYNYKVFTRLGSFWSSGVSGTTTTPIPPINVTALTGITAPTSLGLTWVNPAAANMTEIMVVASTTPFTTTIPTGDGSTYIPVADFTGAGTVFDGGKVVYKGTVASTNITGLVSTTTYYYKVFTRLGNFWSSGVSGTTSTTIPPINVTALTGTPSLTSIALAWTNPPAANMTEIMIVASTGAFTSAIPTGNGSIYTAVADFTGAGTAFDGGKVVYKGTVASATISNLANTTAYNYKVFTRLGNFWSSGVSGTTTTLTPPLNVTNLTGTPTITSIALTWTNPAAANMTEIMVVASTTAFTSVIPTGNGSTYTAIADFTGAGTTFDGGKVVYKGTLASASITGLTGSTAYNYKVFTRLGNLWSSGVSATTTTITPPLNVSNLTGTPSVTSIALTWTNPPAANMTEIMVVASTSVFSSALPTGDGTAYTAVADFTGVGTAFDGGKVVYKGTLAGASITNLTNVTVYNYKVFTRLGNLWSSGVSGATTTTAPILPINVTNLTGIPSVNSIALTWTNPAAANMTEIMVIASTGAFTSAIPTGEGTAYTAVADFAGAGTAFDGGKVVYKGTAAGASFNNLTNLTTYNYKVFTRLGSTWSSGVSGTATTTNTPPVLPLNVTNLAGTPSQTFITLSWTKPPAANMTQIIVVASTTPFTSAIPTGDGTAYTANANIIGAGTAFDGGKVVYKGTGSSMFVTGLTSGTPYYYKVFTRLASAWSSGVSGTKTTTGTPPVLPINVTNLTGTPSVTSIALAWTNPAAANMTEIMVVASTTSFTSIVPTGNGTAYTADAAFTGAGTAFDGGKVLYKGTGANMSITNLTSSTAYNYKVFTRLGNAWSSGVSGGTTTLTPILPINVANLIGTPSVTSIALTWTNPAAANMTEIMVVASTGTFSSIVPTGDGTAYTADASFTGSGTAFDGGKVIYKGTTTNMNLTNLTSSTAYNYKVFTRLGNLWSSGASGTTTTNATPPVLPINVTNLAGTSARTYIILTWTKPPAANMTQIMVVASMTPFTAAVPTGDGTSYTANANLTGSGTTFDGGKVVYKGTGTLMLLTGLTAGTPYYYKVFTRLGSTWSSGVSGSKTTTGIATVASSIIDVDNNQAQIITHSLDESIDPDAEKISPIHTETKPLRPVAAEYHFFPNPASLYLDMDLTAANGQIVDISVVSLMGQVVKHEKIQSGLSLYRMNLEGISNGQYMVRIQTQGQPSSVQKLVIMKR